MQQPAQSEVAQLIALIDQEYTAARLGLHGPSSGSTRHRFITAQMERVEQASQRLIDAMGKEQALPLIVKAMEGK